MDHNPDVNAYDEEIDLKELFLVLWSGKFLIAAITAVFAISSVLHALSIPNQYKATALLAPAQSDGSGLSSALGQLSGLASLAGVSIGEGGSNETQIAQEIMQSWSFIEEFITDNDLAPAVYAAEGWNEGSRELKFNADIYDIDEHTWILKDADTGEPIIPTSWQLYTRFKGMLEVSRDKQSGLVSVSIEFFSPDKAKRWLDLYIDAINEHMQTRQVNKVTSNIEYLEDQIAKTSIAEMREVFYTIVEEQTKNKMVAEASPDYAFITVSPSMVPEVKSQPGRALICILGTLLGGTLGVVIVLVRHYTRSESKP